MNIEEAEDHQYTLTDTSWLCSPSTLLGLILQMLEEHQRFGGETADVWKIVKWITYYSIKNGQGQNDYDALGEESMSAEWHNLKKNLLS